MSDPILYPMFLSNTITTDCLYISGVFKSKAAKAMGSASAKKRPPQALASQTVPISQRPQVPGSAVPPGFPSNSADAMVPNVGSSSSFGTSGVNTTTASSSSANNVKNTQFVPNKNEKADQYKNWEVRIEEIKGAKDPRLPGCKKYRIMFFDPSDKNTTLPYGSGLYDEMRGVTSSYTADLSSHLYDFSFQKT